MVSIFREKSAVSVFWLIALSIVIHSQFIISPPQVLVSSEDGWVQAIIKPLANLPPVLLILLYHAIVIVQALRLSIVLNHFRMFPNTYFIPALCYLLLISLYPLWNNITPALLINFFIIWLCSLMARMYSSPQSKPLIYNIGFLTGFLTLLYAPALFLIPVSFFAIALLRAFRFNEWIILTLGIITPAYLLASVLFLNDDISRFLTFLPRFNLHFLSIQNQIPLLIACIAGSLLILSGIIAWQTNTGRMIIQTRRCWSLLFWFFLLSIPPVFVLQGEYTTALLLSMIPAAALASNFFVYSKNETIQVIFFWLLIIVVVFNNWYWLKT